MYKRIVLKISGESLKNKKKIFNKNILNYLTQEIEKIFKLKTQICIVIGGGNIFRGRDYKKINIDQITADKIGMVSTIINSLILSKYLNSKKIKTIIMSTIYIPQICDLYNIENAINIIKNNKILIVASGLGTPLFTTDTASCLRSIEINADILIKATQVNGVYNKDPKKNTNNKFFKKISYQEIIDKKIQIMDINSLYLAKQYKLPIYIYNINKKNYLYNIINKKNKGTIIN